MNGLYGRECQYAIPSHWDIYLFLFKMMKYFCKCLYKSLKSSLTFGGKVLK